MDTEQSQSKSKDIVHIQRFSETQECGSLLECSFALAHARQRKQRFLIRPKKTLSIKVPPILIITLYAPATHVIPGVETLVLNTHFMIQEGNPSSLGPISVLH